jgi:hypothetical protein
LNKSTFFIMEITQIRPHLPSSEFAFFSISKNFVDSFAWHFFSEHNPFCYSKLVKQVLLWCMCMLNALQAICWNPLKMQKWELIKLVVNGEYFNKLYAVYHNRDFNILCSSFSLLLSLIDKKISTHSITWIKYLL